MPEQRYLDTNSFGCKARMFRRRAGLRQWRAGHLMGYLDGSTICEWENGRFLPPQERVLPKHGDYVELMIEVYRLKKREDKYELWVAYECDTLAKLGIPLPERCLSCPCKDNAA